MHRRHGIGLGIAIALLASLSGRRAARAAVLWTDSAENGYAQIIDNTAASYPLIQSAIIGEGSSAFRLANPGFQDNWFGMNQSVALAADSKLFFLSQLGYAAPGQVARVQMSTDGGVTWPTTVYTQAGTSNGLAPVEGAFTLRTVNLGPYAGQSARFRFYLDYLPGNPAFTQLDDGVGWYVDNIQIADQVQKLPYSIGAPSPEAQLYLEYLNRTRADALVEAHRLKNETDPDVASAYSFFGINPQDVVDQFTASVALGLIDRHAQPLSFNAKLLTAAQLHTQDMFNHEFQGHASSGNPPAPLVPFGGLGARLQAVGYNGGGGENVYSYASSPREGHAGFDVDWGHASNPADPDYLPQFDGQGMQNPAGHRLNIHHGDFKEIGIGVVNGTNGSVGPQLVTQNFGDPGDVAFVTGVVYQDLNGNSFYDLGEGRSGVRVDVQGSAYYAVSTASGGYSVPAAGNGTFDVRFSGGGFNDFTTTATISALRNVKIDYLASSAAYAADFNGDGRVDGQDLAKWRSDFGAGAGSDADDDGDSDGADFLAWQRQRGAGAPAATAIPEPSAAAAFLVALGCVGFRATKLRRGARQATRTPASPAGTSPRGPRNTAEVSSTRAAGGTWSRDRRG